LSKSVSLNMISFSLKRYSWPWTESILTGISHLTSSDKANQILASEFSSKDTGRLFPVSPARCLNVEQYHHHCCQQCHCLGRAINPFPGRPWIRILYENIACTCLQALAIEIKHKLWSCEIVFQKFTSTILNNFTSRNVLLEARDSKNPCCHSLEHSIEY
jgi:hypothetical protein